MRRTGSLIAAVLVLAGCSSDPHSAFASADAILKPIYALKGRPVAEAIAYLGTPKQDTKRIDGRALLWYEDPERDAINNADLVALRPHCLINAHVDAGGTVTEISFDGDGASFCPRGK